MYDVAIIGAGIIGTAIARELSKYELNTVVIEKSNDISNGTTKANSGIVHAGYDAKEESLKAKLNVKGNEMYEELCRELDVPFQRNGSLVIAFNDEDMKSIEKLYKRGLINGVKELEIIDKNRLLSLEPNISEKAVGALYSKTAGIVSPYELAIALGENSNQNGIEFKFNSRVLSIYKERDCFVIESSSGIVKSRYLVNAAGLFTDDINRMLGGQDFKIIPRRGEYCLLDKSQGKIIKSTIFKTPTKKGKGILVTPTVHGNLLIGPNAIEMNVKDDLSTTAEGLSEVINGAQESIMGINMREIITSFTGIRATPEEKDFIINVPVKGAVNAAGIESPGLTAAPAIALMVLELLEGEGLKLNKKKSFINKRLSPKVFMQMSREEQIEA